MLGAGTRQLAAAATARAAMRQHQNRPLRTLARAVSARPPVAAIPGPAVSHAVLVRTLWASPPLHESPAVPSGPNNKGVALLDSVWVKLNGGNAVELSTLGIKNVTGLIKFVKREFSPELDAVAISRINLHLPATETPLRPNTTIVELASKFAKSANADDNPLVVKVVPPPSKTIYVQDTDDELRPLKTFKGVEVQTDEDIKSILESKGSALVRVTEDGKMIKKFKELIDGECYRIFSRYAVSLKNEELWRQQADAAMEEEVALAVKLYLLEEVDKSGPPVQLGDLFKGKDGNDLQEWDAIFRVSDTLYLCEAKHVMSKDKVSELSERVKGFPAMVENKFQDKAILSGVKSIVGVACGTYFPQDARDEAKKLDLWVVRPSGMRYFLEGGPITMKDITAECPAKE